LAFSGKKGHFSPVLIGTLHIVLERKYVTYEILGLSPIKVNGVIVRNLRKKVCLTKRLDYDFEIRDSSRGRIEGESE